MNQAFSVIYLNDLDQLYSSAPLIPTNQYGLYMRNGNLCLKTDDGSEIILNGGGGGGISSLTGDVIASGPGSVVATLANTSVTPGSYISANITVDSKGRITAASNGPGGGITSLTGDGTASGPGVAVFTLANTSVTPGTYTYASVTVDAKGRVTAANSNNSNLVTSVSASSPLVSSGGLTPNLSLEVGDVTDGIDGILSFTGQTGAVIGSGLTITVQQASPTTPGFLSAADYNTFAANSAFAIWVAGASIAAGAGSTANANGTAYGQNAISDVGGTAIGYGANASVYSVAIGPSANVSGGGSIGIGESVSVPASNAMAIGTEASATANGGTAVGGNATASGNNSNAFGQSASAENTDSLACGSNTVASGINAVSVGQYTQASGNYSAVFGLSGSASYDNSCVIGSNQAVDTGPNDHNAPGGLTLGGYNPRVGGGTGENWLMIQAGRYANTPRVIIGSTVIDDTFSALQVWGGIKLANYSTIANPMEGQIAYNYTLHVQVFYNGSAWITV